MKIYKNGGLILLLAFLGSCSVNAYSSSRWNKFLEQPDKDSLVALENVISISAKRCNWGNPDNLYVMPVETGQKLFKLIAKGNEFAFRAGLLVARCLDGGELEDFHRSAGLFFEAQPPVFLEIAKEKTVSESVIKSMLTMLPLDTVDNIDRAIYVIENRIALLKGVSEGRFEEIRRVGLKSLEEQEETLNRIKLEMGKSN